ncbi:cyclic peptide export ABC transporter [Dyella kyungheensis]|uniref:cyclic peptide export ABC transporter n=1 Tax=Dyella kyungheensis TaxID=1242174 RepID=UPI003CF21BD2
MELFKLFSDKAPNKAFLSLLFGALAGVSYALLIPLVMASMDGANSADAPALVAQLSFFNVRDYKFALLFAIICVLILVFRSASQILLIRVAQDATTHLRIKTYLQILDAPISELERAGHSKLLVAITTDVNRIVLGATLLPNMLVAAITIGGMLGYLYLLSPVIFWFVVKAIVFGVITYQIPMLVGNRYFERGRTEFLGLQEAIRGLITGTKELKLSRAKRERYFSDVLIESEHAVLKNTKRANTIVSAAGNYGDLLSFFVIGIVAYVLVGYHAVERDKLIGAIMVLLYITGPMALILNALPQVLNARVSLRNIRKLFGSLPKEDVEEKIRPLGHWDGLSYMGIAYAYGDAENSFMLGPLDIELSRGEITFIVGGNGSGKSTLGKILSLHYMPSQGDIFFGQAKIDRTSLESARQCISAIFTDYYLFDRLLDSAAQWDVARLEGYLHRLGLQNKVKIEQGRFSTLALSDGQRKRLALLVAFVEDRDVYIFDEWAADQDPVFKEVFYSELLPELKRNGKVVVVISHDDRYFHVADKLIVMEEGRVTKEERPASAKKGPVRETLA